MVLYTHFPIQAYRPHTQCLLIAMYVWPSINTDVRRWVRLCPQCQLSKVNRHTVTPLSTFSTPDAQFDKVHLDIAGPLSYSQCFTYLLTCINHFTQWPEAIPTTDITAQTVPQAFLSGWISQFSIPSTVSTDRGHQFESTLWRELMELLGLKRIHTTAFHHSYQWPHRVIPSPT